MLNRLCAARVWLAIPSRDLFDTVMAADKERQSDAKYARLAEKLRQPFVI